MPARVREAIVAALPRAGRYPGMGGDALLSALANGLDLPRERIIAGNGSDELLWLAGAAFLHPGSRFIWPRPGFTRYAAMAAAGRADSLPIPLTRSGVNDLAAMTAACAADGSSVMIIATPNNPTGAAATPDEIDLLLRTRPAGTLLIIDDAYHEYSQAAGLPDLLASLSATPGPWLLTRTFSKAYALAGLRVGYAIASDPGLIRSLNGIRPTFNVNTLAENAAVAALRCREEMRSQVLATVAEREWLRGRLGALGLRGPVSATNFLAVDCGDPTRAARIREHLANTGVLVAGIDDSDWGSHLRIGVGTREEHTRLLEGLGRMHV